MNPQTAPFARQRDGNGLGDVSPNCTNEACSGPTEPPHGVQNKTTELRIAGAPDTIPEFARTDDGSVPSWGEAVSRFRARLGAESPHTARFTPEWARGRWARLLEIDQQLRPDTQTTVLITLTGRTTYPGGDPIPPCIHFDRLNASREAVSECLSRKLRGYDWNRVTIVGVDRLGYLHLHIGLYVQQAIESHQLDPVMTTHNVNCSLAEPEAHGIGAIETNQSPSRDEPTGLVGYLGLNVPALDTRGDRNHGVLNEPEPRVRGATVLEAGEWRAIRPPPI